MSGEPTSSTLGATMAGGKAGVCDFLPILVHTPAIASAAPALHGQVVPLLITLRRESPKQTALFTLSPFSDTLGGSCETKLIIRTNREWTTGGLL